jgi:hypothetical protein
VAWDGNADALNVTLLERLLTPFAAVRPSCSSHLCADPPHIWILCPRIAYEHLFHRVIRPTVCLTSFCVFRLQGSHLMYCHCEVSAALKSHLAAFLTQAVTLLKQETLDLLAKVHTWYLCLSWPIYACPGKVALLTKVHITDCSGCLAALDAHVISTEEDRLCTTVVSTQLTVNGCHRHAWMPCAG